MLDLLLILLLALAAVSGWQRGVLTAGFGALGFLVGGLVGLRVVPALFRSTGWLSDTGMLLVMVQIGGVFLLAGLGSSFGELLGHRAAGFLGRGVGRALDASLGAIAVTAITAVVMWLIASSLRPALPPSWSTAVAQSQTLQVIDDRMPAKARQAFTQFRDVVNASGFPEVFGGLTSEPVIHAAAPDAASGQSAAVRGAADSIVKIESVARSCGTISQGSGWVVAGQRVVTNAHVVSGGSRITVQVTGQGSKLPATVVAFDPDLDLAILAVPKLSADPLPRAATANAGQDAVVVGFPEGGPYTVEPARIRGETQARGYDIYSEDTVVRDIFAVRAEVHPGNSGGPLLTTSGAVAGTVFARSLDQADTAYVITDQAADRLLDRASQLTSRVPTGACLAA